jgi:hypothetical protein
MLERKDNFRLLSLRYSPRIRRSTSAARCRRRWRVRTSLWVDSAVAAFFARHHDRIAQRGAKGASSALRVYDLAKKKAVVTIPEAARTLGLTSPTVSNAVKLLEQLGILSEVTGKQRDRVFLYAEYTKILSEGPPPTRTPADRDHGGPQ